jgi:hypothetical protein
VAIQKRFEGAFLYLDHFVILHVRMLPWEDAIVVWLSWDTGFTIDLTLVFPAYGTMTYKWPNL